MGPGEPLAEAGLYTVRGAGGQRRFAANLLNDEETACRLAGRDVRRVRPAGKPRLEKRTGLASWLFALALVALTVEWLLAWRGGR